MAVSIFKLFGEVFVDNEKANQSIAKTEKNASGLAGTFDKVGSVALGIGSVVGAAFLAVGSAVAGAVVTGVAKADELQGAMNSLQAQTGSTGEEFDKMADSMERIYANNFGESFDEIADVMARVATQTGLTGIELEKATENAFLLSDTFEIETGSSIQAMNTMMEAFGISSERAYELMAIGAQNGANANGDMVEILNEYSNQFEALGFSADTMLETLIEGGESGAFSIDKVGDAIKEFNIRSKDLSDSTYDAYLGLGYTSDAASSLFDEFAKGGDTANMAFQDVMYRLSEIEDPLEQNRIGVALFGSQFEDLESGVVDVLANLDGAIGESNENIRDMGGTLEGLNAIKYDTFGEAIAGISRQFEVGFLIPIGEQVLPILNDFATWLNANMPTIQATFETVFGVVGDVVGTAYDWISGLIDWFKELMTNNQETTSALVETWNNVKEKYIEYFGLLIELFDAFITWFNDVWDKYGHHVIAVVENMWSVVESIFNTTIDIVMEVVKFFTAFFKGDFKGMADAIINIISTLWDGIVDLFNIGIDHLMDVGSLYYDIGKNMFDSMWNGLKGVWNDINSWVSDKVSWIADKLMFWRDAEDEMSSSSSSGTRIDGSHANGLGYVPFDGYIAELHEGERVLTAAENSSYNATSMSSSNVENLLETLIRKVEQMPREQQRLMRAGVV